MASVFIKTSCSTQPRCGDQLSCVFSSPVGCNQRAPGTEQNPGLFALQIPRQSDYASMLHWGWCSSWQTDISILTISNMDQHGCQTLHQLQDKVFITVLKWAKLSLSGFSSFEQGFLAASFFPALLSAWGLEQSHLPPDTTHCQAHPGTTVNREHVGTWQHRHTCRKDSGLKVSLSLILPTLHHLAFHLHLSLGKHFILLGTTWFCSVLGCSRKWTPVH